MSEESEENLENWTVHASLKTFKFKVKKKNRVY